MEHPQQPWPPQWQVPAPRPTTRRVSAKRLALAAAPIVALIAIGAVVDKDEPKEKPLVVGGCLATGDVKPAAAACDDPSVTLMIYRVLESTTSSGACASVPGATAAYTVTDTIRVGGDDGVDVADTGSRVLCVGPVPGR